MYKVVHPLPSAKIHAVVSSLSQMILAHNLHLADLTWFTPQSGAVRQAGTASSRYCQTLRCAYRPRIVLNVRCMQLLITAGGILNCDGCGGHTDVDN